MNILTFYIRKTNKKNSIEKKERTKVLLILFWEIFHCIHFFILITLVYRFSKAH